VILAGLAVLPVALAVTIDGTTYDTWGAYVWAPVLLALAFPLCRWVAKRTGEPEIAGFLFGTAALKIVVGAISRYYMVDAVYGGGDSRRYNAAGNELAEPFRQGVFEDLGKITGTRFIEILTGVVQAVIGQTVVGSFLVFSAFGFVGLCLLYLAFCEALPQGNRRVYRWLLFLTPTMWFWPSSIGKEAFILLCVGATAYGFARMLNGHLGGIAPAAVGVWGAAVVRPHIALMLVLPMAAALPPALWGRPRDPASPAGERPTRPVGRLVVPLLALAALPVLLDVAETFFGIEGLNLESAQEVRDDVTRRTSQGGSEFTAPDSSTPFGFAAAVGTVVLRPFVWEARGIQILTATESLLFAGLLGFVVVTRGAALLASFNERWPRYALTFVLAYAWGFAVVNNFGILARQRSLMFPFLFVLIAAAWRKRPEQEPGITRRRRSQPRRLVSQRPRADLGAAPVNARQHLEHPKRAHLGGEP